MLLLVGACSDTDSGGEANREDQAFPMVLMGLRRTSGGGVEMILPGCEDLRFVGLSVVTRTGDDGRGENLWSIGSEEGSFIVGTETLQLGDTPEGFRETTPLTMPIPTGVELQVLAAYWSADFSYDSGAIFRVEELPEGDSVLVFQVEPLAEVSEEEFGRLAVEGDCVEWPEPAQSEESPVLSSSTTAPETSSMTSTVPAPSSSSSSTASTSTSSSIVAPEDGAGAIEDE